ncbi:MAG TPA: tripartite tricarboxylate transporter substrate binding protein [Ferrovibrio sp.]|uniref:tripartite tricarboxylate transporter substrate binding protein n=1 Tax=Ferrovibrio sp. TaxID=1917215 RepID=UPI002ED52136
MLKKSLVAAGLFAATMAVAGAAQAAYPEKPITYIIAFNAGGESDISARFQQPFFKQLTGQQAIIKYQAGAGGAQAWSQLNGMDGDGYTIMGTNLPHIVLQPLQKDVGYKTQDITNVYFFHYTPDAIFVPKDSKFKSLKDLVDFAKKNPGMLTFGGSGSFSSNQLAQQRFSDMAGIKTTYVPFSGSGPAITAVLGGQVSAGFNYSTTFLNQPDAVRMLAVASEKRLPTNPNTPTFKELGYDLVGGAYRGIGVPKSTPEDIRKQVSDLIGKINHNPEFIKKMEDAGFVLTNIPYEKMGQFMAQKQSEYTALAKQLGIVK